MIDEHTREQLCGPRRVCTIDASPQPTTTAPVDDELLWLDQLIITIGQGFIAEVERKQ